ncbi:MAG: tRNA (cytidine(34)-2'-O)-methyltransferase [Verrucomicrobiales bacterium]
MLHIVLYQPEIPHNTGSAGRLALATGARLHLIKPLGFSLDEKSVRRAGLDYWKDVDLQLWDSLDELLAAHPAARCWFLSTKAKKSLWHADFADGDFLIFGPETRGLPESLLHAQPDGALRIPMQPDSTRSLNLATSVAIVLYEACRQLGSPAS